MFGQTNQGYYNGGMGGFTYNGMAPQQMQKWANNLTPEEMKMLASNNDSLSLSLTQKEKLQGACNHRNSDGTGTTIITDSQTGECWCSTCGYKFNVVDNISPEEIVDALNNIVDILQTTKLMYVDLPADAAREYYQVIPLLQKVPKLFEIAAKNFNKHELNGGYQYDNYNMGGFNALQQFANIMGNGMAYGQPNYNYQQPMNQPMGMGYQQPPMGGYQQPQPMVGGNPFGYNGASQQPQQPMGYQAQNPGFQYVPPTAPVAPQSAPVATSAPATQPAPAETKTEELTI